MNDSAALLKRSVELTNLKERKYPPGTQIMYVPSHTKPLSEFCCYGFIMSYNDRFIFCRFFNDNKSDSKVGWEKLRTRANSEACEAHSLHLHVSRSQEMVDACVKRIQEDFAKGRTGR